MAEMYTKAQLDDAVAVAVADAVAAERVRADAVQRAYKTLLAQTEESAHEQHRLLNQALSLVSKQDEEIENLKCVILARALMNRRGARCAPQCMQYNNISLC